MGRSAMVGKEVAGMSEAEKGPASGLAEAVAEIERAAVELALEEEPAGFVAVLERGGDDE